uniref:Glutamate [NMDA] receptor subunit 1-like n=1 Tax=Dermatophagoides pteronyssinus TaxID=6956 RepID=A0A6P6Y478_DERPT|nr:glutamate [NMDA] receptor subunit 1-like [Dermatophagoides pteronyssinus]
MISSRILLVFPFILIDYLVVLQFIDQSINDRTLLSTNQNNDQIKQQYNLLNNPKIFNIGAILSESKHIDAFINDIENVSNKSLPDGLQLRPKAFEMSQNPIHTARDVCDKLILSEVYAVIVSHPKFGKQSPTSVSFTCGFYNIPVIGISNRDSSLSNKNLHPFFLRTLPPYSHQADVWIQMLLYLDYKNVVIIHSSDSDGRATLNRFQNLADISHIKIESIIEYETGMLNIGHDLKNVRNNYYCRVLLLYANADDAELIFDEIRRQGMDQSGYVWIVSEQASKASNRFDGILSLRLESSDEQLMIEDSINILTNALLDMYYRHNITVPPTNCRLTSSNKWQTGQLFYDYLKKQTLNGRSKRIQFDSYGDRLYSEYEILNINDNNEIIVGKYSFDSNQMRMKLSLLLHMIRWSGGDIQKPLGFFVPKHLKIGTLPEKPFVWAIQSDSNECQKNQIFCPKFNQTIDHYDNYCCQGYCVDLMKELSNRLNFSFDLELVADGQYGNLNFVDESGPRIWTGLVGELVNRRIDMVVAPLTANPERSQVISFSKPFKYEGITILQKRQPRKATLASFLQPFQNTLWLLVLVSVHIVALALYLLDLFSPLGNYKINNVSLSDEPSLNLSSAIWFSWGVLLNSGIGERTPRSFSARVLGMVWAGFAMIVVASYTANLAAFLVLNPRDDHTLSGIEDSRLRNPTESFTFATVKGSAVEMFFRSQVHLFNAYRTMEETNRNSPEEAIEAIKKGELDAFIWDSPRLEYETSQDCDFVLSGELFGRSGYCIGLQKNSFWTDEVTLALLRMHESGFMESLDNKWIISNDKDCESKVEHFPYTLGMKNMAGVFILVFSGVITSFGLIIIEIIYKKRKARKLHRLSIAKKMAIRWLVKVKRNHSKYMMKSSTQPSMTTTTTKTIKTRKNIEIYDKNDNQFGYQSFMIPPPPPPPQRSVPYLLERPTSTTATTTTTTATILTNKQQRTAQQKIYEFKQRKFLGYY